MFDIFFDIIFPQNRCCLCRKTGWFHTLYPWCNECDEKLRELQDSAAICDRCGKYLTVPGVSLCSDCSQKNPDFVIARAVGPYEEQFRIAIKVFKFLRRTHLAFRMAYMMAEMVKSDQRFLPIDIIIPVPASLNSIEQRGFNQTELLAFRLYKHLKIKADEKVLIRVKETPNQRGSSKEDREKNLYDAFRVNNRDKIKDQNVLLVDDVYTTGSTIKECTRTLLEAGAEKVAVISWAAGRGF